MAVFRIEKTKDFTIMSNHHLRNTELSLKAKGLLSLMLSLPEDWDYTTKGLAHICKDGVDSITTALKELERHGYLTRQRLRYDNGQLGDIEYMSRDKESLIEKTTEITAMQEAYSYLTTKFEFGDEMLDDVMALENPLKYFADRWLLPVSDVFDVDMDIRENIAGIRDSQEYLCQREPAVSVLARLRNAAQEVRECPAAEKSVRDFGAR